VRVKANKKGQHSCVFVLARGISGGKKAVSRGWMNAVQKKSWLR